jgi:spore germination cell wall hydrolase CwlJ-like protein
MITPALICIATAIYFEARGEPGDGQIAVAQVIHNRVEDPRYPDNACDVVKQGYYLNNNPVRDKCQFSFWCDGKSDSPRNINAWHDALYLAYISDRIPDRTKGATHYHTTEVYPAWAYTGEVTTKINKHVFYAGVK